MLKAVKIRLYPTTAQATQINKLLGCCRVVYNQCLERKINTYQTTGKSESLTTLSHFFHHELIKDESFSWLNEQNTRVLKQKIKDMLGAYQNFFKQHKGFPKKKSKKDNVQKCRFDRASVSKRNVYTNYRLSLANIHGIKFRCSEKFASYLQKHKGSISSATLTKLACGQYYLSILVDGDLTRKVKETNKVVGIDLGIKDFVITSDGRKFENPHFAKSQVQKVKRLQRQLSRKVKGSNNRAKARLRLARVYKRITDKKQYYLHTVSNMLIDENQVICMEDLNVKGMTRNHNLASSILEMNFGELRRMLEYKAKWYNRKIVYVDRYHPSSKTCSHCGYINRDLTLNDRTWVCPECGTYHDRDVNAAVNILNEGKRIIGHCMPEYTLVDCPTTERWQHSNVLTVDDILGNEALKSSDRLKQEADKEQCATLFKF